jgi:hypothetical protein
MSETPELGLDYRLQSIVLGGIPRVTQVEG